MTLKFDVLYMHTYKYIFKYADYCWLICSWDFLWFSFLGLPDTRALKSGAVAFKEIVEGCAEAEIVQEKRKYRYIQILRKNDMLYTAIYFFSVVNLES